MMVNVLVIDDHPLLVTILSATVKSVFRPTPVSITTAHDISSALDSSTRQIDFVLLELGLPGCGELEAFKRTRHHFPKARIVVVSAKEDAWIIQSCLNAGAAGYIPKTLPLQVIKAALKLITAGGTYVPPQATAQTTSPPSVEGFGLTDRQIEVLRLLTRGLANKQIATQLGISKETVKQHTKAIYSALCVSSRIEALRAAQRHGIGDS